MQYNVESLLEEFDLTDKEKEHLIKELRDVFPHNDMLFELHLYVRFSF
ncbi:MAG: hypothetical protein ACOC44_12145 [Promethearchaeia archaeon]